MEKQFYNELLTLAPDAPSARFLLAVSGGRDSVALAHLFANGGLPFDIAHCNFHLRGEESNREMLFVQKLPFLTASKVFVKEFDTKSIQQKSGKSMEMTARELRYQWFDEIGEGYDYIVTAHHANDNAETVILNMLRGTGLRGICGIPPKNGKIIRPLLRLSGSSIENYCREQEIEYCIDSSNLGDDFLRNKVRHHVIPELEKINPNCIEVFSKNSTLFLQQTQFFDTQIQHYKNKWVIEGENRICIPINLLKNIENQSLVLYETIHPLGFHAEDVENILKSMDANSGKKFYSATHILVKDRNLFIIEKREEDNEPEITIHSIDELVKHGIIVEKNLYEPPLKIIKSPNIIYIDEQKLSFPLTIRRWKQGDCFYPFGMKTKKKVSDFFTDLKIDLLEKQKIRILCSQDKIVWIIKYRADNRFKINENTTCYYKISTINH